AGHVPDCPLEATVLVPGDDHGVQAVARERLAHVRVAALDLGRAHCAHDASKPLIRAVTASFKGVGAPCSRPKRAMPPFRSSISVGCRASTSWSMLALCSSASPGLYASV